MIQTLSDLKTVRFNEQADGVIILDQTLLPGKEAYLTLTTAEEIWDAIYKLKVRGAPAIGIAAAYGIYVCARLTAYELSRAGVDVTLICDNMASIVMRKGWVQAVVVGCDRVAANGDVANKIGTSGVAILARHYKIPFYVLGPTSTIDSSCPDGDSIVIEERNPDEVTEMWYSRRMAPKDVKVYNPAFDITPHELITAIITEKGIFYKNNR